MDPWLFRTLSLLCMLLAGWVTGSRRPAWQADVGTHEISGSGSLEPNIQIFLWILAALAFRLPGWPVAMEWTDLLDWELFLGAFLLHPVSWLQLAVLLIGYLACRLWREMRGTRDFE